MPAAAAPLPAEVDQLVARLEALSVTGPQSSSVVVPVTVHVHVSGPAPGSASAAESTRPPALPGPPVTRRLPREAAARPGAGPAPRVVAVRPEAAPPALPAAPWLTLDEPPTSADSQRATGPLYVVWVIPGHPGEAGVHGGPRAWPYLEFLCPQRHYSYANGVRLRRIDSGLEAAYQLYASEADRHCAGWPVRCFWHQ